MGCFCAYFTFNVEIGEGTNELFQTRYNLTIKSSLLSFSGHIYFEIYSGVWNDKPLQSFEITQPCGFTRAFLGLKFCQSVRSVQH